MIEKIVNPKELRHWDGKIELYCKKCGKVYFPPRMYCEKDFSDTEYVEVSGEGKVRAFTIARLDINEEPMEKPQIYAIIDIDGTDGCLIHLLG